MKKLKWWHWTLIAGAIATGIAAVIYFKNKKAPYSQGGLFNSSSAAAMLPNASPITFSSTPSKGSAGNSGDAAPPVTFDNTADDESLGGGPIVFTGGGPQPQSAL